MLYYNMTDRENRWERSTTSKPRSLNIKLFRIIVLSGLLLCSIMLGTYMDVFANTNDSDISVLEKAVAPAGIIQSVRTVDVEPGDTLWKIAKAHVPNHTDVRLYIEQIKHLNNLNTDLIYVDQLLYLP